MERIAARIMMYLAIGIVLTIASTWLCALLVDPLYFRGWENIRTALRGGGPELLGQLTVETHRAFGMRRIASSFNRAPPPFGLGPQRLPHHPADQGDPHALAHGWPELVEPTAEYADGTIMFERRVIDARGWPLLCMWHVAEQLTMVNPQVGVQERQSLGGIALSPPLPMWIDRMPFSSKNNEPRTLPLRIMPSGFVLNTTFYALLTYLVVLLPAATRRFIRRKRGQCAACGYSLTGLQANLCPECGMPVSRSIVPVC